jgi:hypothetical protein
MVSRMGVTDDYIAIVPMGRNGQLKLFDINGKFLRPIGNIGRGPGEYIALNGLYFSSKFNHIVGEPAMTDSFYLYDIEGNLVRMIPRIIMGMSHQYLQIKPTEIIDVGYSSPLKPNASSDSISIVIQELDGNIVYERNPSISAYQTRIGGSSIPLRVYPFENEIRIHAGQDTLYSFNPKTKDLSVYAVFTSRSSGYDFKYMNELKAKNQYDKIAGDLKDRIHVEIVLETNEYFYLKAFRRSSSIGQFADGTTFASDISEDAGNYMFSKSSNTIEKVSFIDSFYGLNLNSVTTTSSFGGMPLFVVNNSVGVYMIQSFHLKKEIGKVLQDQNTPSDIKAKMKELDKNIDSEESNAILFMYYLKH